MVLNSFVLCPTASVLEAQYVLGIAAPAPEGGYSIKCFFYVSSIGYELKFISIPSTGKKQPTASAASPVSSRLQSGTDSAGI